MVKDTYRFSPRDEGRKEISVLSFSYDPHPDFEGRPVLSSQYGLYLCTSGEGSFHSANCGGRLHTGSLVFIFPGIPYLLNNTGNLSVFCLNFEGSRGEQLMKDKGIAPRNCIHESNEKLVSFWKEIFMGTQKENMAIAAEALLLYTFSFFESSDKEKPLSRGDETVLMLKKIADERYFDPSLSLQAVAKEYNYNPKYLSGLFSRQIGIGFCGYLLGIRIDRAKELMETGIRSVREVARMVGFTDAAYFSRAFREVTGMSPREYLHLIDE